MSFEYLMGSPFDSQALMQVVLVGEALWRYFMTAFGMYLVLFGCVNIVRARTGLKLWGDLDAVIHAASQVRPFMAFVCEALPASFENWKREKGVA